jgi:hypothetical protein
MYYTISMTYYILPKNKINYNFNIILNEKEVVPYSLHSLYNYINNMNIQLSKIDNKELEYINKIVNPYEFINKKIEGTNNSICKINTDSNYFFEIYEIIKQYNIYNFFILETNKPVLCFTNNKTDCYEIFKSFNKEIRNKFVKDFEIVSFPHDNLNIYNNYLIKSNRNDILLIELIPNINTNIYIKNIVLTLLLIINNQRNNGLSIIKIGRLLYKPIIDIIYILCCLFEKVEICKPSISLYDSFLVCNNYIEKEGNKIINNINIINAIVDTIFNNNNIHSLLDNNIPKIFINKLEEFDSIMGQQHLEIINQIIMLSKSNNNLDKIEILKRNNIQKCVQWCEKNKLPYNKYNDRTNIFLKDDSRIIKNILNNIIKDVLENQSNIIDI